MKTHSALTVITSKVILTLGLALVGLAIVNYFSFYPIHIEADEHELFGEPFLASSANSTNPVALVVDTAVIRKAGESGKFSQTDWSYGWINFLLQEVRRYDVIDISELRSEANPSHRSLWVFSRSAIIGSSGDELTNILDKLAQASADEEPTVYLETPDTLSARNSLVKPLLGQIITPKRFTRLTDIRLPSGIVAPAVPDFKFACDGVVFDNSNSQLRALLAFDGAPVLVEAKRKGLRLLLGAFDFGQLAVTIQQGKPNEDFSVTPKITKRTGWRPIVSSDLCADSSYYLGFVPFFDLFERSLFALISGGLSNAPLFENSPKGAFIMSHDEEGMGDKSAWMAQQEQLWGVTSATLVTPAAITAKGVNQILSAGGEVGLHIDQYSYFKHPGFPGLRPVKADYSIAEQKQSIEELVSGSGASTTLNENVVINRNHWLLWSENYTGMLRKLAGAGVKLDLTYGPIGKDVAGYLFGTCFPFVPIDTNGFPLPILELPFLFQDDEQFAAEYLPLIFDTTTFHNEIVNVVFHTNTMGHSPDTLLMWGWRESFNWANQAKLPIVHYTDIVAALRSQSATAPAEIFKK